MYVGKAWEMYWMISGSAGRSRGLSPAEETALRRTYSAQVWQQEWESSARDNARVQQQASSSTDPPLVFELEL